MKIFVLQMATGVEVEIELCVSDPVYAVYMYSHMSGWDLLVCAISFLKVT